MGDEEIQEAMRDKICAAIVELRDSMDTYFLLCGLVAHASILAEALIAAKCRTPEDITGLFAAACGDAIAPTNPMKPPRVVTSYGNDSGTKH